MLKQNFFGGIPETGSSRSPGSGSSEKKGGIEEESRCGVLGDGCVGQHLMGFDLPYIGILNCRGLLKRWD